MKQAFVVLAVVVSLAFVSVAAAGTGGNPPQTTGGSKGKGTSTAKYNVSYADPFFGQVQCTGVHQIGKNFVNGQDSFTCTSTTGHLSNVSPGETLTLSVFGGWISDYNQAWASAFSGVVNSSGTAYTAVASY